jgi:hypothetical protein
MYYVKALTFGPKDHAPRDHVRGGGLPVKLDDKGEIVRKDGKPVGLWRQVERSPYWARMARDGDIALSDNPPAEEIEGYEAPPPSPPAKPAQPAEPPKGE